MAKPIELVMIGSGAVGLSVLEMLPEYRDRDKVRVAAIADSRGSISSNNDSPGGISDDALLQIVDHKSAGHRLAQFPTGQTLGYSPGPFTSASLDAVVDSSRDTAIVDVTASEDTLPLIHHAVVDEGAYAAAANKHPFVQDTVRGVEMAYDLIKLAFEGRVALRATVGANIGISTRVIHTLTTEHPSEFRAEGCVSGTLAYACNQLPEGQAFSEIARAANEEGYTEPTPWTDFSGEDVRNKMIIIGELVAYHFGVNPGDVMVNHRSFIEGAFSSPADYQAVASQLSSLGKDDFVEAIREHDAVLGDYFGNVSEGHTFRYCGTVSYNRAEHTVEVDVGLEQVPVDGPLGMLEGTTNLLRIQLDEPGKELIMQGPGAGPETTARAVLGDVSQIVRHHQNNYR
ncbi:MAG: hypothetical protein QF632_03635 [Candidatus Woesearchaeota archaeon]|jgi:aspartokinase/homoserine dehydrogenase 1|nr:hypothetical protein [Candidatus Woesearchaeota archaeon]